MSLPRYPAYKDSGVEWLGAIPIAWKPTPLKHLAEFANGCVFKPGSWSESGTPIIRIENLNGSDSFNFYNGDVDQKNHVVEGDLLFGWSGNRGTSFGPYLWRRKGTYFLNQHIFRIVDAKCVRGWLFWCLKAVTTHVEDQATGIIGMVHVTKGDLGAVKVPVPSAEEQSAIADLLDRETGKIEALIAAQEMLLALLAEKRQAVISRAVTCGLKPNSQMKKSGVPWLGDVPTNWVVCSIKRMTLVITDGAHVSPEIEGGVYDFVSTKDVSDSGIDYDGALKTSRASYDYLVRTGCKPLRGDVLFSKDGTIGRTVVVDEEREFVVASSLIIIRPDATVLDSLFLHYLCQSTVVRQQVESFVKGAGLPRLSIQNLTKVLGIFPSLSEQHAIAQFLKGSEKKWSALKATAERAIALLEERRSALISAAVTGKIDVRVLQRECT